MSSSWKNNQQAIAPVLFLAPGIFMFTVYVVWPLVQSVDISFDAWDGHGPKPWVVLSNFIELLDDDAFYTSLKNNVLWLVLYTLAIPAGLFVAPPEVRDFLFDRIGAILRNNAIDYIKWDHTRVLPMPDAAQTRGTYALIDRLRVALPGVEIESCASRGGHIDFGIQSRTHSVRLSGSNDKLERLRVQHNAAFFLPSCVTGRHVGPRKCHTSGRILDVSFRAWVAAQRHMGFELDPRELTDEETRRFQTGHGMVECQT